MRRQQHRLKLGQCEGRRCPATDTTSAAPLRCSQARPAPGRPRPASRASAARSTSRPCSPAPRRGSRVARDEIARPRVASVCHGGDLPASRSRRPGAAPGRSMPDRLRVGVAAERPGVTGPDARRTPSGGIHGRRRVGQPPTDERRASQPGQSDQHPPPHERRQWRVAAPNAARGATTPAAAAGGQAARGRSAASTRRSSPGRAARATRTPRG